MQGRAAAMQAAQAKKKPAKSKWMDSSDENESSDADESRASIPPQQPVAAQPKPAPVQA